MMFFSLDVLKIQGSLCHLVLILKKLSKYGKKRINTIYTIFMNFVSVTVCKRMSVLMN